MGSPVQARAKATCPRPLPVRVEPEISPGLSVCLRGTVQTPALVGTQDTLLSQGSQLCSLRPGSSRGAGCLLLRDGSGWENPAFCLPQTQPYGHSRSQDRTAGERDAESPGAAGAGTRGPHPSSTAGPPASTSQDVFSNLDMEVPLQPLGPGQKLGRPSDPQRPEGAAGDL